MKTANVISAWLSSGHSQVEIVRACAAAGHPITGASVSRIVGGDTHPDVETLARLLLGLQGDYPDLACDLLRAYLIDHIPDAKAPDGREWAELVKIFIDRLGPTVVAENSTPIPETELARAWLIKRVGTCDGQRWMLTLYRWANKPAVN